MAASHTVSAGLILSHFAKFILSHSAPARKAKRGDFDEILRIQKILFTFLRECGMIK